MSRHDKIKALATFFNGERPILKPETKVVFNIVADGKRVEPKGMTEQQLETHVNTLKMQYVDILVWNEQKTYKV